MKHIYCFLISAALLGGISSCEKSKNRKQQEQAVEDMKQTNKELFDNMKMTDEGLQVDHESLEKHRKGLKSAGEKMGGKPGEAMKIVSEVQGELHELAKKQEVATESFLAAIDWGQLAQKKDYEARRNTLKEYISINEQLLQKATGFHQIVMDRLDQIGFTGKERTEFDQGFLKNKTEYDEHVTTIRQCDIDVTNISIAVLDRLEKLGDDWQWNAEQEGIAFTHDEDIEWYNAQMDEFQKKAQVQLQAQEKLLNMMKGSR